VSAPWRLLLDGPDDGPWNMGVDEALLDSYADEDPPGSPTLRLYGWDPPTLSLGSRQPAEGAHDPRYLRSEGIALVRRPTGGRAVLHEYERTYAVAGSSRKGFFPAGVTDTYRCIAEALLAGLRGLGVPAVMEGERSEHSAPAGPAPCFDRPSDYEITVSNLKLVGSAQVRRGGAFVQHGSILIRAVPERLARAAGAVSPVEGLTDLQTVLGWAPELAALDAAIVRGFEETFACRLSRGGLTALETIRATRLRAWKYYSASWTYDARLGPEVPSG
jgi:lipoate-protein ligase A